MRKATNKAATISGATRALIICAHQAAHFIVKQFVVV